MDFIVENFVWNVNLLYICICIMKFYFILKKFVFFCNNIKVYNDEFLKMLIIDVWYNWVKNELNGIYFIDIKLKGLDWYKFWKINSYFFKVVINYIFCIYVIFGNNMKFIFFLFLLMY